MKRMLTFCLVLLLAMTISIPAVYASDDTITVNASINNATQAVTISGTISSGAGKQIQITIEYPNEELYVNQIASSADGHYSLTYTLSHPIANATYMVKVNGEGIDQPVRAEFIYAGSTTGGSNIPIQPPIPEIPGILNVEATPDANGKAKADIKSEELASATNDLKGNTIVIHIKLVKAANEVEVDLPAKQVLASGEKGIKQIVIDTGLASITIPQAVLANNMDESSSAITLSVAKVDTNSLSEAVRNKVGDHEVYDFNLTIDGKKISKFNGGGKYSYVEIAVDYTIKPGENSGNVVVYYMKDDGKLEVVKNGRYNTATGKVVFKVKHFSMYAALYTAVTFKDAKKMPWAKESIEALAARGIIDVNSLQPGKNITRAEYVYMLIHALDLVDESLKSTFSDVRASSPYYSAIATAEKLGIAKGYKGKFEANAEISRQDMAVLTYRAALLVNAKLAGKEFVFADQSEIAPGAAESVSAMQKSGIMKGADKNRFAPKGKATVAQSAVVVYRLFELERN